MSRQKMWKKPDMRKITVVPTTIFHLFASNKNTNQD
jgi:hypothetical protein